MSLTSSRSESTPGKPDAMAALRRERLRFSNFSFIRTPQGVGTAEVELAWEDGIRVLGSARGQSSELGDLRIAAEATLRALEEFAGTALRFELVGVKAQRAFDANVIIVSVIVKTDPHQQRLLGCYLAERDPVRGSVLAVLHATNRVLGNFIATR